MHFLLLCERHFLFLLWHVYQHLLFVGIDQLTGLEVHHLGFCMLAVGAATTSTSKRRSLILIGFIEHAVGLLVLG